ncbi:hypothetical protein [Streptomyces sp. MAI_2237]
MGSLRWGGEKIGSVAAACSTGRVQREASAAAWIDPALWLLWLIAHGHTSEQAEQTAAAHPAWQQAPNQGLNALAHAQRRLWDSIAAQSPDNWATPMQQSAVSWEESRGQ